jgi:hypothetical protein
MLSLFARLEVSKTILDLAAGFGDSHPGFDHQLAGEGCPCSGRLARVIGHPTILAVLVPTESAVGDSLGSKILQAAQKHIPFRNVDDLSGEG